MRGVESRTFKSWMAPFWDMEGTESMGLRLSGFGSPCLLSEHAESGVAAGSNEGRFVVTQKSNV